MKHARRVVTVTVLLDLGRNFPRARFLELSIPGPLLGDVVLFARFGLLKWNIRGERFTSLNLITLQVIKNLNKIKNTP
jgi:hypothetical protein